MDKETYNGLMAQFVPTNGTNIITSSTGTCEIISVQYYVGQYGWSECDTEGPKGGDEYSYNWNRQPHFD